MNWQPIETMIPSAPDTYLLCLLWNKVLGRPYVYDLQECDCNSEFWKERGFTHWMKLEIPTPQDIQRASIK